MKKQTVTFAVETKDGVVQKIGKSVILQPKVKFGGGSVKWFDDTKLLKKDNSTESGSLAVGHSVARFPFGYKASNK